MLTHLIIIGVDALMREVVCYADGVFVRHAVHIKEALDRDVIKKSHMMICLAVFNENVLVSVAGVKGDGTKHNSTLDEIFVNLVRGASGVVKDKERLSSLLYQINERGRSAVLCGKRGDYVITDLARLIGLHNIEEGSRLILEARNRVTEATNSCEGVL